jgi:toxin-antitoxin system PIN domain toxin
MRSLLDVNVLIALHDQQHVHHATATHWFRDHVAQGWASCPLTQNGAARVMSQPNYPQPAPLSALIAMFRQSFADPSHAFWPDDISLVDATAFDSQRIHGHRQVTDVYLLGLAVAHGGRLVTLDARIPLSAVHGAQPDHLVELARQPPDRALGR